jgi:hypothetical protein
MVLGTEVAYFSLINVGSGIHCLRSFSFCKGHIIRKKKQRRVLRAIARKKSTQGSAHRLRLQLCAGAI